MSMPAQSAKKRKKIRIAVPSPEIESGTYANVFQINSNESEVVIDFAFITDRSADPVEGIQVAKIILPHSTAMKMSKSFAVYEKSFSDEKGEK